MTIRNDGRSSCSGSLPVAAKRIWLGALGGALLALAAAQGCQGRAVGIAEGSQTHFLRSCSGECGEGLQCLCGVCTQPCNAGLGCGFLSSEAECLPPAPACDGAAPASCGVQCAEAADCLGLGADMACISGRCRGPARPTSARGDRSDAPRVGDACVTADEAFTSFAGFTPQEVNLEGFGGACGPDLVCLVNRFQGRVTCPQGQAPGELGSCVTALGEPVDVPVQPQLASRPAERHVICSCRCDGPDRAARYCACPSGMQCEELIADSGSSSPYTGSYCTYATLEDAPQEPTRRP